MDFKAKLALLTRPAPARAEGAFQAPPSLARLSALVPATQTPEGPLHVVTSRSQAPGVPSPETLVVLGLDAVFGRVDVERLLFLDTETTGLSGGAGTLPFLVGLAFLERGELVVEQLHLPGPGAERPLLRRLVERLETASGVVSFNGRSFDWPLLRTRCVMNRLPALPVLPHFDVLHAARRVLRHRLPEARLGTVERLVLGVERENDLEGAQVPQAWFDFLRTGRVAGLERVLTHNLYDLRSTAHLLSWLGAAWTGDVEVEPEVSLGLAELAARASLPLRAERHYREAVASRSRSARVRALLGLGRVLRARGAVQEAAVHWERALPECDEAGALHLALARLYEHRLRDVETATVHALAARVAEDAEASSRRLSRLARKRRPRTLWSPVDDGPR